MLDIKDKNDEPECEDLNEIFAVNHVISLMDYEEFERFLIDEGIEPEESMFEGFILMAKTVARSLLEKISRSRSLNLDENWTFRRALNRGVPLSKIKNSCVKVIFVKNLHKLLRVWWTSRNKMEFSAHCKTVKHVLTDQVAEILEKNVEVKKNFEKYTKEEIVRRLAILYIWFYLSDTERGYPTGYFFSLSRINLSEAYLSKAFDGYKLSLVFLWKKLLRADKKFGMEMITQLGLSRNWQELGSFFRPLQTEILDPIEEEFRLSFGFGKYFLIRIPVDPKCFNRRFFMKPRRPTLSIDEDLQQTLFWYPVQAMKGSYIFNGVSTFCATLSGTVTVKRLLGVEDKSYVVRFVHPKKNGNDYSYAVLVEAYSNIADYSGWLVFFDCAGDYSGFAGSEHKFAEALIERYKKRNAIEIIEYKIRSDALLNYLSIFSAELTEQYHPFIDKIPVDGEVEEHKKILASISLASRIKKLDAEFSTAKGLLLELAAYYYFISQGFVVKWRYKNYKVIGKDEIDLVAKDQSGSLHLITCMSSFSSGKIRKLVEQAKKIASNRNIMEPEIGTFSKVQKVIFTLNDLRPRESKIAKEFDVRVCILKRLFREKTPFSRGQKVHLERLFGFNQEERYGLPKFARDLMKSLS